MIGAARETFRKLIEDTSKVSTTWARDPQPMGPTMGVPAGATFNPSIPTATGSDISGQATIVMRITQAPARGYDEYRQTYDEGEDKLVNMVSGVRVYGVSFICHCFDRSESPFEILEKLRSRLARRPGCLNALNAMNLSIAEVQGIFDIQLPNSDAAGRKAILDMKFNYAFNEVDDSTEGTTDGADYIGQATIDGELLSGVDGNPIEVETLVEP